MSATPEFSIIISCFNEENSIEEFHQRLSAALDKLGRSSEIIMVNDGSKDDTWSKLKKLFEKDMRISSVMDLFSNAGQQAAVTAGMAEARGDAWVLLDSDLQLEPGELPLLVAEYDKGFDLVSGYRKNRKDSLLRILPSKMANMIMRRASRSTLTDFGCTFKIYNAKLLRAFNLGPFHIFSNVDAISKVGRYTEVAVTHYPRKYGKSGWTFRKLWQYNMDNLVKLSQRPFQLLAGFCLLSSALFLLRILLGFIMPGGILSEVTQGLVLNSVFFFSLMILSAMAMLGEFAIRSFLMLQKNPAYIVREMLRRDENDAGSAS